MDRLALPDPRLTIDGEPLQCKSWLAYGGAYQLTLWSIVVPLSLELHSSYLGHPDADTAVTHLQLRPGVEPSLVSERHPASELPVRDARRFCLYHHLAALREFVADATQAPVRLELRTQALQLVDVA